MEKSVNVYDYYSKFYQNKAIQQIADVPRWTISTEDKMPINIRKFINTDYKIVEGCKDEVTQCMPLFEMMDKIPNALNNTFYLECNRDKLVVLDVEPTCSAELKDKFLNLPYMYIERSMSGLGFHLIFRLPDLINDYPELKFKRAWKSPDNTYELLLNHTITFTRDTEGIKESNNSESFSELFEELAKVQNQTIAKEVDISEIRPDDIPLEEYILQKLAESPLLNKDLPDYNNDTSAYEMGQIIKLVNNFYYFINTDQIMKKLNHNFDDNEIAWLIYEELKNRIPYRDKHNTLRNGMPYLLYSISRGIGGYKVQQAENKDLYKKRQADKLKKKVEQYNKQFEEN